ncbi:VOC family protein [Vibrio sp. PP-XX7]
MSGCIHHVSLTCQSTVISQAYYSQFGFFVERSYEDESVSITLMATMQGARIELFHFKQASLIEVETDWDLSGFPELQQVGMTHFALQVDDIEKYHQRFSGADICTQIRQARLGRFCLLFYR